MSDHALVRIEEVPQPRGGIAKHRFVCACGYVGIPVGSDVFPGTQWAPLAHEYHAAQHDYDAAPPMPIKVSS
jgi:hypothetical protein